MLPRKFLKNKLDKFENLSKWKWCTLRTVYDPIGLIVTQLEPKKNNTKRAYVFMLLKLLVSCDIWSVVYSEFAPFIIIR